jgi:KDO2-lipid IV(A) lauroyltransferase
MQKGLTAIALFLVRLLSFLPISLTMVLGGALGSLGYYVARNRRNVGLKNLTLCFPEMSDTEKRRIIKEHFKYILTSGLQYGLVFYASKERIQKIVKLKNLDKLLKYYKQQPIILLCPHFVGLDFGAIRLTHEVVAIGLYSVQKNSIITEKLKDARLRFIKNKGGKMFARQEGLRPVIKELRKTNHIFYYLPDQDLGERDSIYIPFFGQHTCATVNVLPRLVKMANAVVIPAAVYWNGRNYEMEFYDAWGNYPTDNLEADVIRMNKFVEQAVMKNISQYFWLHKRFKTQPGVERGSIYKDC